MAGNEAWDQTQSHRALDRRLGEAEEPGPSAQGGGCWLSSRATFCQEPEAGPLRPRPHLVTNVSWSCRLSPGFVSLAVPVGRRGPRFPSSLSDSCTWTGVRDFADCGNKWHSWPEKLTCQKVFLWQNQPRDVVSVFTAIKLGPCCGWQGWRRLPGSRWVCGCGTWSPMRGGRDSSAAPQHHGRCQVTWTSSNEGGAHPSLAGDGHCSIQKPMGAQDVASELGLCCCRPKGAL